MPRPKATAPFVRVEGQEAPTIPLRGLAKRGAVPVLPPTGRTDAEFPSVLNGRERYTGQQCLEMHTAICAKIAEGIPSRRACAEVGVYRSTWRAWMREGTVDRTLYAHSRLEGADVMAEGILDIAADRTLDHQERRVMVDAAKWVAARLYPKRWGDKVDVTSGGQSFSPIAALPSVVMIQTSAPVNQIAVLPDYAALSEPQ